MLVFRKGRTHYRKLATTSSSYVFLVDVSGSMSPDNKLPLLKRAVAPLVKSLKAEDKVSIVTYPSDTQVLLNGVSGDDRGTILSSVESLQAGGCTYGESGIKRAYEIAEKHFIKGGNNRIIMATGGDFNVGMTSDEELKELIEKKRKSGIYLTILGFGQTNLNDSMMMQLAKHGNGG